MTESHGRIIRKRNPGMLQPDEEVTAQFVVREHELSTVLEILRGNVEADSCQHTLIVAPRGRGKTMLLARIAAELRADAELASCLLPVRFMEESDEVFSAADFWLEALFYLALAIDKPSPEFARSLRDTREDLASRWRERELDERARAAVLEAADTLGMRLVLMVENLQALCANADADFGWKLRKTLQTEPQIILVATATSSFEGLDDAREPFFELFRTISLAPLDTAQCRRLWEVVSGDTASEREIRPLEILTGGSPRFLVIVAGFARHRSLRRLMEDLVRLIDDLTDTFRGDLQALPKTERRVFLAVADLWQPSTTGEIAARARMDVRTVSTMLGRLVERGAVVWSGTGRKRFYDATERLYSIYYKLRRVGDEAAIVQSLLHFMAVFYREAEIAKLFGGLKLEALASPAILAGIERVQSEVPQLSVLTAEIARNAQALTATAVEKIERAEYAAAIAACDTVISRFVASEATELQAIVLKAYTRKALAQGRSGNSRLGIETNRKALARFGASDAAELQHQIAIALFNLGVEQIRLGELDDAIATCDEVWTRFRKSREDELQVLSAKCLINKGSLRGQLGDRNAEIGAYFELINQFGASDVPELQVEVATALFNAGVALARLGNHHGAIAISDKLVERYGTSDATELQSRVARALINKGVTQTELGLFAAATATFDDVRQRYGGSNAVELRAWVAQSLAYKAAAQDRLGSPAAAIRICEELASHFGACKEPAVQVQVASALLQKGASLGRLRRHPEAIAVAKEVMAHYGDSADRELHLLVARAMNNRGASLALMGDASATIATSDALVDRFGSSDAPELQAEVATALFHKGMNQIRNGRADEALLTADQLDRRRQAVGHDIRVSFNWNARYVRMSVRLSQGSLTAAVDAFCSLYAAFAPENETMIPELVEAVAMLATAGVPERELVEVLRSEPQKAACVAPLSIALRQRDGERVRAPAEVLAVAADVRKRIDETGLSPLSTIPKKAMASAGAHRESETWVLGVRPPAHRSAH